MSGIATGTALMIAGGVAAGGSLAGAAISSKAAGKAADKQAAAADQSAQLQYQASQNALDFQKQQWNQSQANIAPWLQSGIGGLANLDYLLGINPPTTQGTVTGGSPQGQQGGLSGVRPVGPSPVGGGGPVSGAYPGPIGIQGAHPGMSPSSGAMSGYPNGMGMGNFVPQPPQAAPGVTQQQPATVGTGNTNLGSLVNPNLGAFGSLMTPYAGSFTAPTDITEQNDPGYQARLKLGTDAMQRSAAARGGLLTGGTARDLNSYGQDYASNEYGNVYNRALTDYTTKYNAYNANQANQFNRLAALSGVGQQSANQLSNAGQAASNNISSNLLDTAKNMGQQYNNAAAASASGYIGSANAWSGALGNTANNASNLILMRQLYGGF